jgi:hypothetical protein
MIGYLKGCLNIAGGHNSVMIFFKKNKMSIIIGLLVKRKRMGELPHTCKDLKKIKM